VCGSGGQQLIDTLQQWNGAGAPSIDTITWPNTPGGTIDPLIGGGCTTVIQGNGNFPPFTLVSGVYTFTNDTACTPASLLSGGVYAPSQVAAAPWQRLFCNAVSANNSGSYPTEAQLSGITVACPSAWRQFFAGSGPSPWQAPGSYAGTVNSRSTLVCNTGISTFNAATYSTPAPGATSWYLDPTQPISLDAKCEANSLAFPAGYEPSDLYFNVHVNAQPAGDKFVGYSPCVPSGPPCDRGGAGSQQLELGCQTLTAYNNSVNNGRVGGGPFVGNDNGVVPATYTFAANKIGSTQWEITCTVPSLLQQSIATQGTYTISGTTYPSYITPNWSASWGNVCTCLLNWNPAVLRASLIPITVGSPPPGLGYQLYSACVEIAPNPSGCEQIGPDRYTAALTWSTPLAGSDGTFGPPPSWPTTSVGTTTLNVDPDCVTEGAGSGDPNVGHVTCMPGSVVQEWATDAAINPDTTSSNWVELCHGTESYGTFDKQNGLWVGEQIGTVASQYENQFTTYVSTDLSACLEVNRAVMRGEGTAVNGAVDPAVIFAKVPLGIYRHYFQNSAQPFYGWGPTYPLDGPGTSSEIPLSNEMVALFNYGYEFSGTEISCGLVIDPFQPNNVQQHTLMNCLSPAEQRVWQTASLDDLANNRQPSSVCHGTLSDLTRLSRYGIALPNPYDQVTTINGSSAPQGFASPARDNSRNVYIGKDVRGIQGAPDLCYDDAVGANLRGARQPYVNLSGAQIFDKGIIFSAIPQDIFAEFFYQNVPDEPCRGGPYPQGTQGWIGSSGGAFSNPLLPSIFAACRWGGGLLDAGARSYQFDFFNYGYAAGGFQIENLN
jgi:hypothetical protein